MPERYGRRSAMSWRSSKSVENQDPDDPTGARRANWRLTSHDFLRSPHGEDDPAARAVDTRNGEPAAALATAHVHIDLAATSEEAAKRQARLSRSRPSSSHCRSTALPRAATARCAGRRPRRHRPRSRFADLMIAAAATRTSHDLYALLGVRRDATAEQLRRAYDVRRSYAAPRQGDRAAVRARRIDRRDVRRAAPHPCNPTDFRGTRVHAVPKSMRRRLICLSKGWLQ